MSRVGRKIIPVPKDVKVQRSPRARSGRPGAQGQAGDPGAAGHLLRARGTELTCKRTNDERQQRAFHGLARALAQNAIKGVTEGFTKELDIVGVGYKARGRGQQGRVRPRLLAPRGVQDPRGHQDRRRQADPRRRCPGIDRQKVGQVAAEIRGLRKPDPYKQKGIRYVGEVLKKKAGKAGATGAGAK